jgi:hypothetical protein
LFVCFFFILKSFSLTFINTWYHGFV